MPAIISACARSSELVRTAAGWIIQPAADRELGVAVVCIGSRQAHQSLKAMKANKTDPHDAAGPAQLARTGFYKEVHVKSPAAYGVRSVITARSHMVEARVWLDNMIRGLCATFGYRPGAVQRKSFLTRIMQAAHIPGLSDAITSLLSVRAELVEQIKETDRRLRIMASQPQACEILRPSRASACKHLPPSPLQSMKPDASDNPAMPGPTSASCPDAISLASSTGQGGSPSWVSGPYASCSTKRPTRSSPGAGKPSP